MQGRQIATGAAGLPTGCEGRRNGPGPCPNTSPASLPRLQVLSFLTRRVLAPRAGLAPPAQASAFGDAALTQLLRVAAAAPAVQALAEAEEAGEEQPAGQPGAASDSSDSESSSSDSSSSDSSSDDDEGQPTQLVPPAQKPAAPAAPGAAVPPVDSAVLEAASKAQRLLLDLVTDPQHGLCAGRAAGKRRGNDSEFCWLDAASPPAPGEPCLPRLALSCCRPAGGRPQHSAPRCAGRRRCPSDWPPLLGTRRAAAPAAPAARPAAC